MSYKKPLKLYIAHKLSERQKIFKITKELEKNFQIICLNPFYSVKRKEIKILDKMKTKKEQERFTKSWNYNDCKQIVETDLHLIDVSDGILAFLKTGVLGTAMEIQYARIMNKRIYIITKKYKYHAWIRYYADEIFTSVNEFKKWLKNKGYEKL